MPSSAPESWRRRNAEILKKSLFEYTHQRFTFDRMRESLFFANYFHVSQNSVEDYFKKSPASAFYFPATMHLWRK